MIGNAPVKIQTHFIIVRLFTVYFYSNSQSLDVLKQASIFLKQSAA